jgi:hypothetical protein
MVARECYNLTHEFVTSRLEFEFVTSRLEAEFMYGTWQTGIARRLLLDLDKEMKDFTERVKNETQVSVGITEETSSPAS